MGLSDGRSKSGPGMPVLLRGGIRRKFSVRFEQF
jgi:hypothetical protein